MSSPLTAAMAWALAAKVYAVESLRSGPQEPAGLREQASALLDHARKLDDSADLCMRAQAYLESPVKPASHYAPKSATCRVISNAEYAERVSELSQKPTRRRGAKPASLPQLLSAAANSLKEP